MEQIIPRCSGPGFEIKTQDKRVEFKGGGRGSLWVKSAADHDTVNSIRGMGKKLGGVITNEAAHFDLQYALENVIGPATVDNGAWVTIQSTPRRGSYFNTICTEAKDGSRPLWFYSHATFRDNSALPPNAEQSLAELVKPGTDAWREEIEAELLAGGAGFVCPMWDYRVHVHARNGIPPTWRWAAGLDWGTRDPTVVIIGAQGPEDTIIRYEFRYEGETAFKIGYKLGKVLMRLPAVEYIAADSQMFNRTDGNRQDRGPTLAERMQKGLQQAMQGQVVPLVSIVKGPGSVESSVDLLQELMAWSGNPEKPLPWQRPRLTIHDKCTNLIRTLPKIVLADPKPGKPASIKEGQDDHALDALRYYLMSRAPRSEDDTIEPIEKNRHPGFGRRGERKRRGAADPAVQRAEELEQLVERSQGRLMGFQYDTSTEGRDLVEYSED